MQLYVQAVMSSDDFDKDVFDMEHLVVYPASAHSLNHNTYHGHVSQKKLRCSNPAVCRQKTSLVLLHANAAYMQHNLCNCKM